MTTSSAFLSDRLMIHQRGNRMRSSALTVLISAILLTFTSQAFAAGKEPNRLARERTAKKACLSGDPTKGVEVLAELYLDTNDIAYLFNQGRCFEQNRRYEDAVARFREYLVKGEFTLSEDDKALARKRIDACESYLPKPEPRVAQAPEPVAAAPIVESAAAPSAPPAPVEVVAETPPEPSRNQGAGLRIAGIVMGSVGVAALGAGLALNLKVNSMSKDLEKPDNFNRDTDTSRKNYKTLGWIGYGAGAALLAGGTLLYVLGWRSGHASSQTDVAVVPTMVSGSAGILLRGAF